MRVERVVVALDSFKGSITAVDASAALARGVRTGDAQVSVVEVPIADGGEGTVAALVSAGFQPRTTTVEGPLGDAVDAVFGVRREQAVVELAEAAGLGLLAGQPTSASARRASTYGVGELVLAAAAAGASSIMVGLGGSCSTDGGAGLAQALGLVLRQGDGTPVRRGGGGLPDVSSIEIPERAAYDGLQLVAATDVTNPLLGPLGAAAVYAPQKGATAADVAFLDHALEHWADIVTASTGRDVRAEAGTGAAGGAGFGLAALLDAEIVSGIDLVLDLVGFDELVRPRTLVVVGEGSFDQQSLHGKGPVGTARRAAALGAEVVCVAGRSGVSVVEARSAGITTLLTLTDLEPDPQRSMSRAAELLEHIGRQLTLAF